MKSVGFSGGWFSAVGPASGLVSWKKFLLLKAFGGAEWCLMRWYETGERGG